MAFVRARRLAQVAVERRVTNSALPTAGLQVPRAALATLIQTPVMSVVGCRLPFALRYECLDSSAL